MIPVELLQAIRGHAEEHSGTLYAQHEKSKAAIDDFKADILFMKQHKGEPLFIMCSNMGDKIDPAMWRRFDKVIEFKMPDIDQRTRAFKVRLEKHKVPVERIETFGAISDGLSFSEIRMSMDKAIKKAILKKEKKMLPELIEACIQSERRAMSIRGKSYLNSGTAGLHGLVS